MMPDFFHIIPVGDDSMLNWVFESKNTSLGPGFISNIGILLPHTHHHTLVSRASNNGRKDSSGSIIACKASFAHSRSIVNNQSGYVFITHPDRESSLSTFSIKQ